MSTSSVSSPRSREDHAQIRRLMLFFALVYVAEGAGQTDGLIAQPLNYYLKQVFQWTPVQITAYLTVLNLPWFIKPLYGAVSDFVPLFGYRRTTYLIAANGLAAAAYFAITLLSAPGSLVFFLLLTAYGMAISSTLCGAVLVEGSQRFGLAGSFVNQQWLWYNVASMTSALMGGLVVQWLTPAGAVHTAALLVGLAPLAVMAGTLVLVREEKRQISSASLKTNFAQLGAAFREGGLWILAVFLFFYYFSPGFTTPLYFYMTDTLKFSQFYIGALNAIESAGWIAAALLYGTFMERLAPKQMLNLSIASGIVATLSFLFMADAVTAAIAHILNGLSLMMMSVATLSLAAERCPKHSEGFVFAAMMSVTNIAGSAADNAGSYLFEHAFANRLFPLVLVSAAFTAVTFLLVPMLRLESGRKREDAPAETTQWNDKARSVRISPGA